MRTRKPEVLKNLEKLRLHLNQEKFKRERYCSGKHGRRKIDEAAGLISTLDDVEEFVRTHIPEEEWKGMLGA